MNTERYIKKLERELEKERTRRQELEQRCKRLAAIINRISQITLHRH